VNRILAGHPRIHIFDPLPYEQLVHPMPRACLILADSC
jgi:UDP-N-acetylglucosamine 2-epimerase